MLSIIVYLSLSLHSESVTVTRTVVTTRGPPSLCSSWIVCGRWPFSFRMPLSSTNTSWWPFLTTCTGACVVRVLPSHCYQVMVYSETNRRAWFWGWTRPILLDTVQTTTNHSVGRCVVTLYYTCMCIFLLLAVNEYYKVKVHIGYFSV